MTRRVTRSSIRYRFLDRLARARQGREGNSRNRARGDESDPSANRGRVACRDARPTLHAGAAVALQESHIQGTKRGGERRHTASEGGSGQGKKNEKKEAERGGRAARTYTPADNRDFPIFGATLLAPGMRTRTAGAGCRLSTAKTTRGLARQDIFRF